MVSAQPQGSPPRQHRHASRRRALDLARRDTAKGSLSIKLKRAGWNDAFLPSLLNQLANPWAKRDCPGGTIRTPFDLYSQRDGGTDASGGAGKGNQPPR